MTTTEVTGSLSILNVGAGDVLITFDKDNPGETIRAKRVIADMLRRGFALIVEVERNGERAYERVQEFDAERGQYIIADFDPLAAKEADMDEAAKHLQRAQELEERAADTERKLEADLEASRMVKSAETATAPATEPSVPDPNLCHCGRPKGHRGAHSKNKKRLPMESTKATAIGRSSGG